MGFMKRSGSFAESCFGCAAIEVKIKTFGISRLSTRPKNPAEQKAH